MSIAQPGMVAGIPMGTTGMSGAPGATSANQQFCLRWNDFQTNMVSSFQHLRDEKSFTDVTLACDGQTTKAHKMVLSACSPYFKKLLEENPAKHPIVILKDVEFKQLKAILDFMYSGEVNVAQEELQSFLKVAERLKVKGLAEVPNAGGGMRPGVPMGAPLHHPMQMPPPTQGTPPAPGPN
ncbi:unnamed protein product [Notodromas monacha]|uniref:BTB domain-containing protein n=1 Tax=Notodromas monacha TaxID=399045 RepID=A0A7R9BQ04_9CRUS|nr:unnamed protein product [Notodromas monacha]CAG0919561.1 unnamed protein product [Notodromas monacha]